MLFCPFCASLLLLEESATGLRFSCHVLGCSYVAPVRSVTTHTVSLQHLNKRLPDEAERKDPTAATEAEKQASGKPRTTVACPADGCASTEAEYEQVQTRSADEPPSTFYACLKCGHTWRTD